LGLDSVFVENLNYPLSLCFLLSSVFQRCCFILVSHSVNCHLTISHDFPSAEQTDVVPEQPRALAVVPDALPAAVAARTDVAPARVEAAAYTYYVPWSVAEQA